MERNASTGQGRAPALHLHRVAILGLVHDLRAAIIALQEKYFVGSRQWKNILLRQAV
jgi:hypothetical protein